MKKELFLYFVITTFTSCEIDDSGDLHVTPLGWWILVLFIVVFVILIKNGNKKTKANTMKLKQEGLSYDDFKPVGMYVAGHPKLNESIGSVYVLLKEKTLKFYRIEIIGIYYPEYIENGDIKIDSIKDIKIEDASQIERRVTLGRFLVAGIFSVLWQKRKKKELAFMTIVWQEGKFEQNTTFVFEGKNAFTSANTARNELMKMCE
ncbi:hypothetical protein [Hoylesella buccalis]|nr:hypothetical protein [Hoylesella buccalis]